MSVIHENKDRNLVGPVQPRGESILSVSVIHENKDRNICAMYFEQARTSGR